VLQRRRRGCRGRRGGDGIDDARLLLLVIRWETGKAVAIMPLAVTRSSGGQAGVEERMAWRV